MATLEIRFPARRYHAPVQTSRSRLSAPKNASRLHSANAATTSAFQVLREHMFSPLFWGAPVLE